MQTQLDHILNPRARVDWKAALLAGLVTGVVLWLLSHGTPWFTSGMVSPTLMGRDLKPAGLVDASQSALIALAQIGVALAYTLVLAPLVTRFRGVWAIIAGGCIGFGLYLLNFVLFRLLMSVQFTSAETPVLVTHVVFGMIAAGIYKGIAARKTAPPAETGP